MPWSQFVRSVAQATRNGPVLVTRRGKPCCMAVGFPKALQVLTEGERMAALVAMGEQDIAAGKTMPQARAIVSVRSKVKRSTRRTR